MFIRYIVKPSLAHSVNFYFTDESEPSLVKQELRTLHVRRKRVIPAKRWDQGTSASPYHRTAADLVKLATVPITYSMI